MYNTENTISSLLNFMKRVKILSLEKLPFLKFQFSEPETLHDHKPVRSFPLIHGAIPEVRMDLCRFISLGEHSAKERMKKKRERAA